MRNLDQIRAKNALRAANETHFRGAEGGSIVKKIPTMIRENGLLGALAFACEKNSQGKAKSGDHHLVFEAVLLHLKDTEIKVVPETVGTSADDMLKYVAGVTSSELRAITDESMAYLSYLRRFAAGGNE